jgi:hypothetical protein
MNMNLNILKFTQIIFLGLILINLSSCLPKNTPPASIDSSSINDPGSQNTGVLTFPFANNFLQEGVTQTNSTLPLMSSFVDSFLLRGQNLSDYLKTISQTTTMCLVAEFKNAPSTKILALSAKRRSFNNTTNNTLEYYLQIEPANEAQNQVDCFTVGLINTINTLYSTTTVAYSFSNLTANWTTFQLSENISILLSTGGNLSSLNTASLKLQVTPGSTTTTGQSCVSNSACSAQGYDCCLQGQCVNDGAVKSNVNQTLNDFLQAKDDVLNNPNRVVNYPQYFYICPSLHPTTPTNTPASDENDPDYSANVRVDELKNLYECLNPQLDEISYCTIKHVNAANSVVPAGTSFSSANNDLNFGTINTNIASHPVVKNNIYSVKYAGIMLYQENAIAFNPLDGSLVVNHNDSLNSAQSVIIKKALPINALDGHLYIKYKIDGTCEKISSTLARCSKAYVQGQQPTVARPDPIPSDHANGNQVFLLPPYADLSKPIIVKVGDTTVPQSATTWLLSAGGITFQTPYPINQNQKIHITYYSSTNVNGLTQSRNDAQAEVNTQCQCGTTGKCNLKPVYETVNNVTKIINYECSYPTNIDPPLYQIAYVSGKSAPLRYFDSNGVAYDDESYANSPGQELAEFKYTNNNNLKPNNYSSYIGPNEVYGSFTSAASSAKPPKKVDVKKDTTYDIFVDSGGFSTCPTCGSDAYSVLQKLFPNNFSSRAAGYFPDIYANLRIGNSSIYRPDDLIYGRACFVPLTMIPWTHNPGSDLSTQRRSRLNAQHILMSNGYNRDWYGFDYGSLIGSFDGVSWFSIGNQRRIKATSKKLYLAVNTYFGDLTIDNNFKVVISEATNIATSGSTVDHDTKSDGAECQKQHFCSKDDDCYRQLGTDYSCQVVTQVVTKWPVFDSSATETIGSVSKNLVSIVGGSAGQSRRCVYRGRGAPCEKTLTGILSSSTFNNTTTPGLLACSANNYCENLSTASKFNDRLSRFPLSAVAQNLDTTLTPSDLFGISSRLLGRPFEYNGTKTINLSIRNQLSANNVKSICIPGKNLGTATSYAQLNTLAPTTTIDSSDRILGIGMTANNTAASNYKYYMACPTVDSFGQSIHTNAVNLNNSFSATTSLTPGSYLSLAVSQNMTTNVLDVGSIGSTLNIFNTTAGSVTQSAGYQRNQCLRAPGASCITDFECGPSEYVASRFRTAYSGGISGFAEEEEEFWSQELVCGNPSFKYVSTNVLNPNFKLNENKCCRNFGKTFTLYSEQQNVSDFNFCVGTQLAVPGVNTAVNVNATRYSRLQAVADKVTCSPTGSSSEFPVLKYSHFPTIKNLNEILYQYKTLDIHNQRMCCTGNWVRSFAAENGGGHKWGPGKIQDIDKEIFKHINWNANIVSASDPDTTPVPFECGIEGNQFQSSYCEIKDFAPGEENKYLEWIAKFELLGIPQVMIELDDPAINIYKRVDDNQNSLSTSKTPLNKTITQIASADAALGLAKYSSATNTTNFDASLKKVFAAGEFNCCIPTGKQVPTTTTNEMCCAGTATNQGSLSTARCCLADYSDITVYLNRYVSSEGRGLPENNYDPKTGYIKDPAQVYQLAIQKNICCSGKMAQGVAVSKLHIPLDGGNVANDGMTRRFVYRTDSVDNNAQTKSVGAWYDVGLRWNNHWYCVPDSYDGAGATSTSSGATQSN